MSLSFPPIHVSKLEVRTFPGFESSSVSCKKVLIHLSLPLYNHYHCLFHFLKKKKKKKRKKPNRVDILIGPATHLSTAFSIQKSFPS